MSLRKQYETSSVKENSGITLELFTNPDGTVCTVTLSRMSKSNKAYSKALEEATAPHRNPLGQIKPAKQEEIFKRVFCSHLVMGWANMPKSDVTGVISDTGYIDCTPENVYTLVTALPDLYMEWQQVVATADNYRIDRLEAEAKN